MSKTHIKINNEENKISLKFDLMYAVKASRRQMPPPMKTEEPKKGKGSYLRKEKYKSRHLKDSEKDVCSYTF